MVHAKREKGQATTVVFVPAAAAEEGGYLKYRFIFEIVGGRVGCHAKAFIILGPATEGGNAVALGYAHKYILVLCGKFIMSHVVVSRKTYILKNFSQQAQVTC